MAGPERCDVAIWDVNGELTAGMRRQMTRVTRHDGPQIAVESGLWHGRRIAVGYPQRVTAARAATLSGCLRAMSLGNPANRRVVIGPATAITGRATVGDVVLASEVHASDERIAIESSICCDRIAHTPLGDGELSKASAVAATTDWAAVTARAGVEDGEPTLIVAVVTATSALEIVQPPPSRRRTLAREAGAYLGRFLKGQSSDGANAHCVENAAQTLATIVQAS